MNKIKKLVAGTVTLLFCISSMGCNMIQKTPEAVAKTVVATVNKDKITKADVDAKMQTIISQAKAQYGDEWDKNAQVKSAVEDKKKEVLEQLVTQKLILQKAKELKLVPTDEKLKEETDKQLADIKKSFGDDTKYKDTLKQQGYTEESLYSELKENVIEKAVYDYVVKDVKVEDKEIQDEYDKNKTTKYTEKPNQIHLAHILVKTEDEANKVEDRLQKGEDFKKLAKELSLDTGSKDNGGEYTVPYENSGFDQTFMIAALATPEGKISKPVQTQFGFHVIKVIKKEEYPPKKFEDVKEEIKTTLEGTKKNTEWSKKYDEWKKDAKIKEYPEKLS